MTAADHANTVREAIGANVDAPDSEEREGAALAAVDALQAQAEEAAEKLDDALGEVGIWQDSSGAYCERMLAAEAERDRLAGALRGLNEAALAFYEHALPHEEMFNGQDHDRFVALDNALSIARAALDRTEQP